MNNVPPAEAPAYWDAGPRNRRLSNGLRADTICRHCCSSSAARSGRCCSPIRHSSHSACAGLARLARRSARHPYRTPHWWPIRAGGSADLRDFDYVLILEAGADKDIRPALSRAA